MVCMKYEKMFDVVDLDLYGMLLMFLDSVVMLVKEGGFLFVIVIDMVVFCGNNVEVVWVKY